MEELAKRYTVSTSFKADSSLPPEPPSPLIYAAEDMYKVLIERERHAGMQSY